MGCRGVLMAALLPLPPCTASGRCSTTRWVMPWSATCCLPTRSIGFNGRLPEVAETVDRRVVASPAQVKQLLAAVRSQGDRGAHLHAYFAVLYFAGLRPSEGVALRGHNCVLPQSGWGRLDLTTSEPRAGQS